MTVEEALRYDHNSIVEEFTMYQTLPPKLQTELINKIFSNFMKQFKNFFNSCEQGFRNEFIINLYARIYMPGTTIQEIGKEPNEVVLIQEGMVDMYSKSEQKFM